MAKRKLHTSPWGFQVSEKTIREIDARLKKSPDLKPQRKAVSDTKPNPDARTDKSILSAEVVDRDGEVVLIDPLNYEHFLQYPRVFWDHDYADLPIGYCQWIKKDGPTLIAQTKYAERPADLSGDWFPDLVFALIAHEPILLPHKSIGFISDKRTPTHDELEAHPEWAGAILCDNALLLEYSVVGMPANPDAVVLNVAKHLCTDHATLKRLGIKPEVKTLKRPRPDRSPEYARATEAAIVRQLESIDAEQIARDVIKKMMRGA